MRSKIFYAIAGVLALMSCSKLDVEDDRNPVIEPPFEQFRHFWTEVEKKEGSGNWMKISNGQVLRLYTDDPDTAKIMNGKYEYDAVNAKLMIPMDYYFRKDADSLYFYRSVNLQPSDPSQYTMQVLATAEYKMLNDSVMVILNSSAKPVIEVKYRKM